MYAALALVVAGAVSIPAPTGLDKRLLDDAADGKLDSLGLLEAALVASGVPDAEVPAEAARARAALAPAIARAKAERDPHARGDVLLRALHDSVFRTYALTATEIDDVIHTGRYNCLSSALLFVVASDGLLDAPRAMVTKYHAFARVKVAGRDVDVETTTATGFDADRAKLMTPEYVKKIAGDNVTPAELLEDLKHPEELPVLSLVAGVYSNRAVGLVHRGDMQGAAVALDRAAHLASGQLRARTAAWRGGVLNNGAVELVDEGRLDDARGLLELALEGTEGQTRATLTKNLATVHLKIAVRALDAKDWTGALAHVDVATKLGAAGKDAGPIRARADAALAALEGNDARCAKTPAKRDASECFAGLAHELHDKDPARSLQYGRRAWALDATAPNAERALLFALVGMAHQEAEEHHCDVVEALVHEAAPHTAVLAGQKWTPDEAAGNCWAGAGDAAFDKQDWATASAAYERARAHEPSNTAVRGNLAAVDVNRAIELAKTGDCDEARGLAHRATRADASLAEKSTQLLESCAAVRGEKAAAAKDWARAVAEVRRGLLDAPQSEVLRANLATGLHNLAAKLLRDKDCADARVLVTELDALKDHDAVAAIARECR